MHNEEKRLLKKNTGKYSQSIFTAIVVGLQTVILGLLIAASTSGRIVSTHPVFNLAKACSTAFNVAVLFKTALKIFSDAEEDAEEAADKSKKISLDYIITIAICMAGLLMWLFLPNLYIK